MIKTAIKITLAVLIVGLLVPSVYAGPTVLSKAQMDSVTAGRVTKVYAFVCPVITSEAMGIHNPKAMPLGDTGTWTVTPPTGARGGMLMVPEHATNANGYGKPGVSEGINKQSQPGDTDYTAIWKSIPQPQ